MDVFPGTDITANLVVQNQIVLAKFNLNGCNAFRRFGTNETFDDPWALTA